MARVQCVHGCTCDDTQFNSLWDRHNSQVWSAIKGSRFDLSTGVCTLLPWSSAAAELCALELMPVPNPATGLGRPETWRYENGAGGHKLRCLACNCSAIGNPHYVTSLSHCVLSARVQLMAVAVPF